MKNLHTAAIISTAILLTNCSLGIKNRPGLARQNTSTSADQEAGISLEKVSNESQSSTNKKDLSLVQCTGKSEVSYKGFGDRNLMAGQVIEKDIPEEGDRYRIKPYEVFASEFNRVAGTVPNSLRSSAATFGAVPNRWYEEAVSSSFTIFATYRIAYEAGLNLAASDATYQSPPSEDSATKVCTDFATLAWNRVPSSEEVESCKNVALVHTKDVPETNIRWAHTIASILAASGFIAY